MKLQKIILFSVLIGLVVSSVACSIQAKEPSSLSPSATSVPPTILPNPSPTSSTDPTQMPTATIDPNRRPDMAITTSAVTPDGSLWYAFDTFDDFGGSPPYSQNYGLYRLKDGQVSHFDIPATIRVLEVAPDGSLYVGAGCGVLHYHADNWEILLNVDCDHPHAVSGLFPLNIAFADGGDVWVGGALKLARFNGRTWKEYDIPAVRVALASDDTVWTIGWNGRADSHCCITHLAGGEWITYTLTANVSVEPEVLQSLFDRRRP